MQTRKRTFALLSVTACLAMQSVPPPAFARLEDRNAVSKDDVAVSHSKQGDIEFVVASIHIDQPPDRVWPILANPFEFEQTISPKFHTTKVLVDRPDESLLECKVDVGFLLPPINYTVFSSYAPCKRITFKSTAGDLKDFEGSWSVQAAEDGKSSDVTYSMYVNPGIPVPQWLVRQGIRMELPHTLRALRDRVYEIYRGSSTPTPRSLTAAHARTSVKLSQTDCQTH